MYFYLIENGELLEEVFATNLSDYEVAETEKELVDKNGKVKVVKSEKRLDKKGLKNVC